MIDKNRMIQIYRNRAGVMKEQCSTENKLEFGYYFAAADTELIEGQSEKKL